MDATNTRGNLKNTRRHTNIPPILSKIETPDTVTLDQPDYRMFLHCQGPETNASTETVDHNKTATQSTTVV